MLEFTRIEEVRAAARAARAGGSRVGLVPTLGYLHEGHISLCAAARRECGFVVASIFVNPLQFAPTEDFDSYPRDLVRDLGMLRAAGVDAAFTPSIEEMYPEPMQSFVSLPELSRVLEGETRPTHFQGVATVVLKLLQIAQPDSIFFGQKDWQQTAVVRRMVHDLSVPVAVMVVPTVRESDGLALSSRNVHLDASARQRALRLFGALSAGRALLEAGERNAGVVARTMHGVLSEDPAVRPDYAAVVDPKDLSPLERVTGRVLLAVAAYVGGVRLIDNFVLDVSPGGVRELSPL